MTPAAGDRTRGETLWHRACASCHGAPHTGDGRTVERASVLPDDTEREHTRAGGYDDAMLRQVFVEKTRHGNFLGLAGVMPPFAVEVLPDQDLADIIAWLDPQLRD